MQKKYYTRQTTHGLTNWDLIGGSAYLTLQEAEKYGIQYREIPNTKIFEVKYKNSIEYFRAQVPYETRYIGYYGAANKSVGKALLEDANISVCKGFSIFPNDPEEYWDEVFASLKKPLVVKPTHGTQGKFVFTMIDSLEKYKKAVKEGFSYTAHKDAGVIIEEMFMGEEYRILATDLKVIGIINRKPANVIGDGRSTLQELIDQKNSDPRRGDHSDDILVKIKIDQHVKEHLERQHLTLQSVPAQGERVLLRLNSNISTGGDSIDVTDVAHPSVKEIALKTIAAFPGIAFAGIDFMTIDITKLQTPESYVILEINDSPGYSIHDQPYEGKNRHAAYEFLCIMFPQLRQDFPQPLD